jgi:CDP-paratose 2-epimerase
MAVLVTGSSGLIGSEAVLHFDSRGDTVVGVDNNQRREFFGPRGDTLWNLARLQRQTARFRPLALDIRDRDGLMTLFREYRFDLVVHCAAQPSHDKAREIPLVDFEVNALGTLNLLEATRLHAPEAVFIHMSTNKVYGDAPNEYPVVEQERRYDYERPEHYEGVDEHCRIDQCLHSLFGASKTAADVMAQEYGRYFGLKVGVFRGGCLTGPAHSAVELHGFLAYLAKVVVEGGKYTVFGYKGKQVRDQIHSVDVISAFEAFAGDPRPGEVYNLGGGRQNAASVLECIALLEEISGAHLDWRYEPQNRTGDHVCYISNMTKFKAHYPSWTHTRSLRNICTELVEACRRSEAGSPARG